MSTALKTINRLTRKIEILESMIEDRSRQAYYEATRRSTINALLELSLKADDIDNFLSQVLELLFSVEALSIDPKGAVFLFDKQRGDLALRVHSNLSRAHINSIRRLPVNQYFSEQVLSRGTTFHSSECSNQFIKHLPDMEPHGHYYVPIRTGNRNYGLIILFISGSTPRNSEDINFFTSIADICAGALERMNYSKQILDYQRNLEQQVEEQTRNLLEEKERLAVTLRSIGDGVITTDLDGKIVLINKITEQLTGWSQQEAVGRPVQDVFNIINEKTGKPCDNPVAKVLASGKIVGLANHTALIAKDGSQYSIEDSGAPIFDKESKIIGTVLVFRDVTEKRRTAEELLKVEKLESVGVLAGGIAHDFNNILAAILGNIELAGMSIGPTSAAYPLLQDAKKASLRAKDLTQQLLTFSKGGDPVKKTTPIGKTIIDSANFVLHGSPVSCRFSIPDDLWLVDIDSGQISQVIQNLVINAKHAMPDGGEARINCINIADIRSETTIGLPCKAYVKISVQDTGCGIAEKHLEKIFDPYFSTRKEGSGLGLAITHSIISKHDGHIAVQSQIGEGTTFTIYLPASDQQVIHDSTKEVHESRTAKARILVMDDELLVQDIAEQMLDCLGHEALQAADGKEAIEIFNEHRKSGKPVDVIIMDLTIPGGMGGKDAIQEILKIDPEAKVIVSSGYSNDPIMADYQQYGFKAAIAKPFLLSDLNKTLTDVLS
jgi:PAS domain S-box-containing protein